jgi:hypothetical protein
MGERDYVQGFNTLNKPNYVTSSQGSIYINGILIDECYDIQYMYQELKQPIYGYNSKHYDAVLPGQVVVSGSFTINYIHDAYLLRVVERSAFDREAVTLPLDTKKDLEKEAENRKKTLLEIKEIANKKAELSSSANTLKEELASQKEAIDSLRNELSSYIAITESEIEKKEFVYSNYLGSLVEMERAATLEVIRLYNNGDSESLRIARDTMNSNSNIKDVFEKYLELERMKETFIVLRDKKELAIQKQQEDYNKKKVSHTSTLNEMSTNEDKISFMRSDLSTIKSRMESINSVIARQLNDPNITEVNSYARVENSGSFEIVVEYNGKTHKVITGVELLGHSHVMGHAGNPVQEVYKFYARNIE